MISCYPQNNEHMLTSRQLREKTQNIMNQIPAFQDRMKPAEQKLLDRLLADERLTDKRWIAYIMATVKHETNHTFEPIEEAYWLSNAWRQANLRYWPAHGRGFVQITWPANYEKMSHRLNIPDLARDYDLALDWDVAYEILVVGMIEGLFTGKDLDDYINDDYTDYKRARRIVNGMDKARLIAHYAEEYEREIQRQVVRLPDTPEPKAPKPPCAASSWEFGNRGPCVQIIQRMLNKWADAANLKSIVQDGDFGPQTKSRVQRFQLSRDLDNDGVVGPKTWLALEPYL